MGLLDLFKPKPGIKRGYLSTYDKETIKERWKSITTLLDSANPSSRRAAVVEADKILDYALDRLYPGLESTGERLKLAKELFRGRYQDYDQVWFAHKVRNQIVHDLNFEMPAVEAAATAEKIRSGLNIMGAAL